MTVDLLLPHTFEEKSGPIKVKLLKYRTQKVPIYFRLYKPSSDLDSRSSTNKHNKLRSSS